MGAHYISNNYTEDHLYDFGGFSLNTSYNLVAGEKASVVWEQQIILRQRENGGSRRSAFIASTPLLFRYQPKQKTYYLGLGPAYLNQHYEDYAIRQKVSGMQLHALAGMVLRQKETEAAILTETHIRAGIFKNTRNNNAAPHVSVLFLLRFRNHALASR